MPIARAADDPSRPHPTPVHRTGSATRRWLELVFAAAAYLLAMANLAYLIGFIADIGVPKGIAGAPSRLALWQAVAIDAGLVFAFGLHHSVTARTSFKRWWTRRVPAQLERPVYLCMTAAMSALLVAAWQPIPVSVWQVEAVWAQALIRAAYVSVWLLMFAATFQVGHLGFFGLARVLDRLRDRPPSPSQSPFAARWLYGLVRHPIGLGWMLVPWLVPHLSVGHVVFALATALYVLCATRFEEADLLADLGQRYRDYRRRVPAFLPWPRPRA